MNKYWFRLRTLATGPESPRYTRVRECGYTRYGYCTVLHVCKSLSLFLTFRSLNTLTRRFSTRISPAEKERWFLYSTLDRL